MVVRSDRDGGPIWKQWPFERHFRPPFGKPRKPVKGGRWHVRKDPYEAVTGAKDKRWLAYQKPNRNKNRRFYTHAEAIAYATRMANEAASPL